jgi:ATP/maltotriose-dependent transcriptional regulator MalT
MNMDTLGELERGRAHYARRAWADAYRSLSIAEQAGRLGGDDLELLAMSAYLTGRDDDYLAALGRTFDVHAECGESLRAARCAFWLGLRLMFRGEMGRASGWLARAQRLVEGEDDSCAERGYLLVPVAEQLLDAGDSEAAYATAGRAAEIGERCRQGDLVSCARHIQGRVRIHQGQVAQGLTLLDEAMVWVTSGELSPLVTGLVYCSVIEACQEVYAWHRAREWTAALARWCAEQDQLVAFTGLCSVHRAEILQLQGAWQDSMEEARRACERCVQAANRRSVAAAFYQEAEVHRLRGDFSAAEEAYRSSSEWGRDPQPGLALLRLAQGRADTAAATIRRAMSTPSAQLQRTRLLYACVEIMIAIGEIEEARNACCELEQVAEKYDMGVLGAIAAEARGAIELEDGDPCAALSALRRAWQTWQEADAPYMGARVRLLAGLACRALGDEDGASLELGAAKAVLERLGATPDLTRMASLVEGAPTVYTYGLTARELQVLRLVATGDTNKAIAARLFLSEKTVDRHVSNIFNKLNVPTRAAATAFAYEHKLI